MAPLAANLQEVKSEIQELNPPITTRTPSTSDNPVAVYDSSVEFPVGWFFILALVSFVGWWSSK